MQVRDLFKEQDERVLADIDEQLDFPKKKI